MDSLDTELNLETILKAQNLCDEISDDDLLKIGETCVNDFERDADSMEDWKTKNEKAYAIFDHNFNPKNVPWHGAANAKFPLVLTAAIRFNSEAGAELFRGDQLVKAKIFGQEHPEKLNRARRVPAYMNFQINYELDNWGDDMDRLLLVVPILGCAHKKVYHDHITNECVSELCLDNVTIHQETSSIKRARITQEFSRDRDFIHEREAGGIWREIEYSNEDEDDGIQEFIEQHRRIDLDGDGYGEPYICVVHKDTRNPVRIIPNFREEDVTESNGKIVRIEPDCHFVKYGFIPAPDGSYWNIGWGILLGPMNDSINTVVNQLLDAGSLANRQGGWISSAVRVKRGDSQFQIGEWKTVKHSGGPLKDAFMPLPVRDPSNTMFALLGLLLEQAQDVTSVNDIMQGDQPQANMAASSVMALIEQGKKTFNAIYKRLYRSLQAEFKRLYSLNYYYLDAEKYSEFHDEQADPKVDFGSLGYDIRPTANPEFSSRVQRMARAEGMMNTIGHPNVNASEVLYEYYAALLDDEEEAKRFVSVEPNMTPQQIMEQMEVEKQGVLDSAEVRLKELDEQIKEIDLEIAKLKLDAEQKKSVQQEAKSDQSEFSAVETALRVDIAEEERRKKIAERELVEAKIEEVRANAAAQKEETEILKREASGNA